MRFSAGLLRVCLSIAVVVPVAGAATPARQVSPGKSPSPAAVDEGPLVAAGEAPDLILLYTGGVVGYVEPCG